MGANRLLEEMDEDDTDMDAIGDGNERNRRSGIRCRHQNPEDLSQITVGNGFGAYPDWRNRDLEP